MFDLGITKPRINCEEKDSKYRETTVFTVEPLERGFGLTLGNALRRTLLSSLPGAAACAIKIDGVQHEYSTIKGVKEDVVDIILNIKSLCLKTRDTSMDFMTTLKLRKYTPGEVYASDIEFNDQVEIVNPDLLICTLEDDASIDIDILVKRGRGYVSGDINRSLLTDPLYIPIDSIFSPVKRVSYRVETARQGQSMNYDRLILEVTTNGTITAMEATSIAAKIIQEHSAIFVETVDGMNNIAVLENKKENENTRKLEMSIEDLALSVRSTNCLKRAGINTVNDLTKKSRSDMTKFRNMGIKSVEEVVKKLEELGLKLREDEE